MIQLKNIYVLLIAVLLNFTALAQDDEFNKYKVDAGDDMKVATSANVEFNVNAYSLEGYSVTKYEWDFDGDGTFDQTAYTNTINHIFNVDGVFYTKLRVTFSNNKSKEDVVIISVGQKPDAQESNLKVGGDPITPVIDGDGIEKAYAVMINGGSEQRFWDDVDGFYKALTTTLGMSANDVFLFNHNGSDPSGNNPGNMIDNRANLDTIEKCFRYLSRVIDGDDRLIVWIDDHGDGYRGDNALHTRDKDNHVLGTRATVEDGDTRDYLESNFKLRTFVTPGDYKQIQGLDQWAVAHENSKVSGKDSVYYRIKYMSHYTNVQINGVNQTDNDVYIERFTDYLAGDVNKNGRIDAGEVIDFDNDGKPPYNSSTGAYDEGDWGQIDAVSDNYNSIPTSMPGSKTSTSVLFDKNLDNKLDIDLNAGCSPGGTCVEANLIVDGTDLDNDGLLDQIDVNEDGDYVDWVSVDEIVCLVGNNMYDDDLKRMLKMVHPYHTIVFLEPCFSGGFIDDLSGSNRIIMSATVENQVSWGNTFVRNFTDAVTKKGGSDTNGDGVVSMQEAFNYSASNDRNDEEPQYDDNGDQISHTDPIPNGNDGSLGNVLTLIGFVPKYFCPTVDNINKSGTVNGIKKIEKARISIQSTESITGGSDVAYVAEQNIILNKGFTVDRYNTFNAFTHRLTCLDTKSFVSNEELFNNNDSYSFEPNDEFSPVQSEGGKNIIDIFPNPSNGSFTITLSENIPLPQTVKIVDILGKEIVSFETKERTINVTDFVSGFYFVFLNDIPVDTKTKIVIQ